MSEDPMNMLKSLSDDQKLESKMIFGIDRPVPKPKVKPCDRGHCYCKRAILGGVVATRCCRCKRAMEA